MAWIKRNLYFAIGSLIAIILMGAGGYLLYQQMSDENKVSEDITSLYAELDTLNNQSPHPGMAGEGKTDNVKAAQEQRESLRAYIEKIRPYFKPIAAIPDISGGNKVSNADIATQLRNTIVQLQRTAEQQSVILPHDYYFSFEAQRKLMIFDPASHEKIATHLGEIKALCEILFDAKINSLEFLRREVVSTDDLNAPDYLPPDQKTTSTPLADLTPYRVTFQCFSTELAAVLGSLAASPYGLIVKNINVEPASPTASLAGAPGGFGSPAPGFAPGAPGFAPNPGGFGGPPHGGMANQYAPSPNYPPQGFQPTPAAPARPGMPTVFLNEKPLRVTLLIEVVKLKPMK